MNKLITPIPANPDYETKPFKLLLPAQCPNCSIAYSKESLTS